MCKRESKQYGDELEWHGRFFPNVISRTDEEVFRPLYTKTLFGAPTKPFHRLVAMNNPKEGADCAADRTFGNCRYDLPWRKSPGLSNLDDECPSQTAYRLFRAKVRKYEQTSEKFVNLYKDASSLKMSQMNIDAHPHTPT